MEATSQPVTQPVIVTDPRGQLVKAVQQQAVAAQQQAALERADKHEEEFNNQSQALSDEVNAGLQNRERKLEPEVQKLLANASILVMDIDTTDIPWLRKNLQLLSAVRDSVRALLREPAQVEYAKRVQNRVKRRLHPLLGTLAQSLKRSISSSPITAVVSGLFLAVLIVGIGGTITLWRTYNPSDGFIGDLLSIAPITLVLIGAVGALGSIVSIMLRIRGTDFTTYTTSTDPWPFFFFALFKPVVGAAFALFAFAAIKAGLLPIGTQNGDYGWLYAAVAFIAGFSERFTGNVLASTENSLVVGPQGHKDPAVPEPVRPQDNGKPTEVPKPNTEEKDDAQGR